MSPQPRQAVDDPAAPLPVARALAGAVCHRGSERNTSSEQQKQHKDRVAPSGRDTRSKQPPARRGAAPFGSGRSRRVGRIAHRLDPARRDAFPSSEAGVDECQDPHHRLGHPRAAMRTGDHAQLGNGLLFQSREAGDPQVQALSYRARSQRARAPETRPKFERQARTLRQIAQASLQALDGFSQEPLASNPGRLASVDPSAGSRSPRDPWESRIWAPIVGRELIPRRATTGVGAARRRAFSGSGAGGAR